MVVPSGPESWSVLSWSPRLFRSSTPDGRLVVGLGHPVVDDYLEFAAARCRPNTVLAAGYDMKVFFSIVDADPVEVSTADVLAFVREHLRGGAEAVNTSPQFL